MKKKIARYVMTNPTLRRLAFLVARKQAKKRGRKYAKIGLVVAIVSAVAGGAYLASRNGSEAPAELSPASY